MESTELHNLYKYLIRITKRAYKKAGKLNTHEVEKKELNDIATFTDKYMEKEIVNGIKYKYPNHKFLGEEYGESNNTSDYEWLIDPIDGTINFASNIPMFGTSIALRYKGEVILGIIFDWPNNHIYHAIRGEGAYCDNKRIHVSNKTDLSDSIITICLTSSYDKGYSDKVLDIIQKLQPHVRGIRIIVCTTYELVWLASGKSEGMINVKPGYGFSSASGGLMISEAGGMVTNLENKKKQRFDTHFASNGLLHEKIYEIIK